MMSRLRISNDLRAPIAVGVLVFFATLIACTPASLISLALPNSDNSLAYRDARGTIWRGEISGASISSIPLGDVSFQLSPSSLFMLAPELKLAAQGGDIVGEGRVTVGSGMRVALRDVKADILFGAIAPRGVFGQPAYGRANLTLQSLIFSRHAGCQKATGAVWTDVLDAPSKRFNLPSLPMSGDVHCDGDALLVALAGENARTSASVTIRIEKSLTYEITATARPSEESVASALRVFGFEDDNGSLIYGSAGVLTGAGS